MLLSSHRHAHGVPSQGARAAHCETSSAAAVGASALTSLVVCVHVHPHVHILGLVHIVVHIVGLSFYWGGVDVVVYRSEAGLVGLGSRVVVYASTDLVVMIDPVVDVGFNSCGAAVERWVVEGGVEPGRTVVDGGRRGRGVGSPVSEASASELVEFGGRAETAHLELAQESSCVADFLVPFNCAPLGRADELPNCFLLVGVPDNEFFLLDLHSFDVAQLDDCFGGGDVGQGVEGQLGPLVEFPCVSQDFNALQQEEPVVGHHETLLFFGDDRVGDVLPIDIFGVGQLGDVLPQPG